MGDEDGLIGCGSYFQDIPSRLEFDGISSGYAWQNYMQTAGLAQRLGRDERATHWRAAADRIRAGFQKRFWLGEQCAECIHLFNGPVTHGMSDVDWIAQAMGLLEPDHDAILWVKLSRSERLYYGVVATGVCEHPQAYLPWQTISRYHMQRVGAMSGYYRDVAAMGRVWFIEAMARHRRGDGDGLADTIRRVATIGRAYGWNWWERYMRIDLPPGPVRDDMEMYLAKLARNPTMPKPVQFHDLGCIGFSNDYYGEWPANLVRICCQWLAGVDISVEGLLTLTPAAPRDFFEKGFGLDATLLGRTVVVRYDAKGLRLEVGPGPAWKVRLETTPWHTRHAVLVISGRSADAQAVGDHIEWKLPTSTSVVRCRVDF